MGWPEITALLLTQTGKAAGLSFLSIGLGWFGNSKAGWWKGRDRYQAHVTWLSDDTQYGRLEFPVTVIQSIHSLPAAAPPPPLVHPALPKIYCQKVANLRACLDDPDLKAEAMEAIRSLIEAIELVPEDGKLRIELRGELGGILALCANAKKPGQSGTERAVAISQIKLVAGTGFEPVTFRL